METLLRILEEIDDGIDWRKETHLVDDRILDSLAVITMITDLEEEFHVEITRENFNSAEAIWKMICRLKEK